MFLVKDLNIAMINIAMINIAMINMAMIKNSVFLLQSGFMARD